MCYSWTQSKPRAWAAGRERWNREAWQKRKVLIGIRLLFHFMCSVRTYVVLGNTLGEALGSPIPLFHPLFCTFNIRIYWCTLRAMSFYQMWKRGPIILRLRRFFRVRLHDAESFQLTFLSMFSWRVSCRTLAARPPGGKAWRVRRGTGASSPACRSTSSRRSLRCRGHRREIRSIQCSGFQKCIYVTS